MTYIILQIWPNSMSDVYSTPSSNTSNSSYPALYKPNLAQYKPKIQRIGGSAYRGASWSLVISASAIVPLSQSLKKA